MSEVGEAGKIQLSLFDERDLAEIQSLEYPGERLIVCKNPLMATRRAKKRQALLEATERELNKIVAATSRALRPLKGEAPIGLPRREGPQSLQGGETLSSRHPRGGLLLCT